jgi:putative glutathione S-transferase
MGRLVNGQWTTQWYTPDEQGRFVRDSTVFHDRVSSAPGSRFTPDFDRYHLYVSYACPWAHRTLLARVLNRLEDAITISVVDPFMGKDGWTFSTHSSCVPDPGGAKFLYEIYLRAKPDYTGRVTVPILWDKRHGTIVNNESREILRMLDTEFTALARPIVDLCPETMRAEIDRTLDAIYKPINNGVYLAGFATKQDAYDEAVNELFHALDHWDAVLATRRFLCGDRLTEADICMFTTLVRFDPVYHGHFKCNLRRIADYPELSGYLRDIFQTLGVAATCRFDHIKEHYYRSHEHINPTRIVPKGPIIDLDAPHGRDRFATKYVPPHQHLDAPLGPSRGD